MCFFSLKIQVFFVFCERGEQVLSKKLFKNSHLSEDSHCPQDDIPLGKFSVCPECSCEVFKLYFIPKKANTGIMLHIYLPTVSHTPYDRALTYCVCKRDDLG